MNKSRSGVKLIPILTACLLAQGCVGVLVGRRSTETFKQPSIAEKPATYAIGDATSWREAATSDWLRDHWGKPASIRPGPPETQGELWTYKFGPVWDGVVPCLIVPIPLVLPLGREKVVFLVREGEVVSADVLTFGFSGPRVSVFDKGSNPWVMARWW